MTVASTVRRNVYNYIAGQTVFPFTFPVLEKSHVEVYVLPTGQTTPTLLVNGVDYTVFGEGNDAGGNVTLAVATTGTGTLTILREVPYTQPTDFKNQGSFFPRTHERAFDRVTMLAQQIAETLARSLTLPVDATGVNTELPYPTAGNLIGWDSSTLNIRNFSPAEIGTTVAFGNFRYDRFTATPGQTAFTLAADPGALGNLDVSIDGVTQVPIDDYTLAGSTLTLTGPMAGGERVLARYGTAAGATDASVMTWQPAGAGAVQRTVQDKLREFVSVKDFGARGDGVADDTAAIQAALNFIRGTDGPARIYFPCGEYRVSSTLSYVQPALVRSVCIEGEEQNKTVINYVGGAGTDCFSFSVGQNAAQEATRISIRCLSFKTSTVGAGSAIRVSRPASATVAPNNLFEDIYVYQESGGHWTFGIRTTDSSDQWLNRCYLMHFGNATTACLFLDNNLSTQSVYGTYVNGCSFNGGVYNIRSTGQIESVYVNNSSMVGADDCLSLDATGTPFGNPHLTVAGCHINAKRRSIDTNLWRAVMVTGTDVYSGVGVGDVAGENLRVRNGSALCVTGSKFEIGAVGVARSFVLVNNVRSFSITGNTMENATAAGIVVIGASEHGIVSGNVIRGFNDGTPNNEGIFNTATGGSFVYSGNTIQFFNKGILFNSAGNVVSGNVFNNITGVAIEAVGGSGNIAKSNSFLTVASEYTGSLSRELFRTATVDPASVAAGARATITVAVSGAAFGDFVDFAAPYDLQGMQVTANVQSANNVALNIKNDTAAAIDLPSGTWRFRLHN